MKKRLVALLLSFSLSVCMCVSAFAADTGIDIIDDPLSYYFQNQLLGVQKGTGVTLVCPNGDYKTLYTGGTLVTCPYDGEALELASEGGVTAKKALSGVGRPKGYGDEGKANVNSNGKEILWVEPFGISGSLGSGFYSSAPANLIAGASASGTQYFNTSLATVVYYFVAPVSGLYYLGSAGSPYDFGVFNYFSSDTWKSIKIGLSLSNAYSVSRSLNKGDKIYYCYTFSGASVGYGISQKPYKFNLNKIPIFIEPLGDSSITTTNNITINNNTWNGNIYTDNSTNLTYIYPQYTTINENNETVTNISENPIIYNNETKQYYTYDSVTQNYYYITYNENPTTPTPSPSATPDPDNPGVTPTPTPTPGGDTGDTTGILAVLVEIRDNMIQGFLDLKATLVQGWADLSANFTLAIENLNLNITNIFNKKFPDQSTPETADPSPSPSPSPSPDPSEPTPSPAPTDSPDVTPTPAPTDKPSDGDKTNNFWTIIFPSGGDDASGEHKGIFWALVSLILALIAFFTNLAAGVGYLFPFLPDGVVLTINTCLFVIFLFVIVKFIMRSK